MQSTSASPTAIRCVEDEPLPQRVVVLGIGNLLWADEGFGVRCVEALQHEWEFGPHVSLVDGGTQGLYLIQYVQEAEALLIFDAVDYGLEPGTLKEVHDEEVPHFLGAKKMSLHQTGFQEVLALAQLTGRYPRRVVLLGCQPEELEDYGGSLRPVVKTALRRTVKRAVSILADWGAQPQPRREPLLPHEAVTLNALDIVAYEGQRPSEEEACRIGDARALALRARGG